MTVKQPIESLVPADQVFTAMAISLAKLRAVQIIWNSLLAGGSYRAGPDREDYLQVSDPFPGKDTDYEYAKATARAHGIKVGRIVCHDWNDTGDVYEVTKKEFKLNFHNDPAPYVRRNASFDDLVRVMTEGD